MMSMVERLFYLLLVFAFGVISVAFEGTVNVPDWVFWVAVTYFACGVVLIIVVNVWSEKTVPTTVTSTKADTKLLHLLKPRKPAGL